MKLRFLLAPSISLLLAGCVTPADQPDRSTSTRPDPTLDRPYGSPSEAPAATGQGDGGYSASVLSPPNGPPGFNGGR